MIKVILSLPVPLDGDIVIQGESLEAVQVVFGGAVIKCHLNDARDTVAPFETFHRSCETLIVMFWPADERVMYADLLKIVLLLCEAVIVMLPFPEPLLGDTLSHDSLLEAIHSASEVMVISLLVAS